MTFFPWLLYILAWVCTLVAVQKAGAPFWPVLLLFTVIFNGGIQGVWAAVAHLGFPELTAKKMGWKSGQYQTEIGFANLAIGLTSLCCVYYQFWVIPVGLILALFWIGVVYTHTKDRFINGNKTTLNSGPIYYCYLAVIVTLMACIITLSLMQLHMPL